MSETPPSPAPVRRNSCLLTAAVCAVVFVLVLGGLWWWFNRPIQPVVLTPPEKAAVEKKMEVIQKPDEPTYEKGAREIVLTERELNGLLNENGFGKSLKLELVTNAIHARFETDLDKDLPFVGGRRLKARARFLVGGTPGHPALVLDDMTVWGISLPNDWLAGMKGRDLLGEAIGGKSGGGFPGVEEFTVESGKLVIRLKE